MITDGSQQAWIRACISSCIGDENGFAGESLDESQPQALSFHPFYGDFSVRAKADCIAAMSFAEQECLALYYQRAESEPDGVIAGILALRLDVLLARQFVGVYSNIGGSLKALSGKALSVAQAVYLQLWAVADVKQVLSAKLTDSLPLSLQQCEQLLALFDKPDELALYLSEYLDEFVAEYDAELRAFDSEQIEFTDELEQAEQGEELSPEGHDVQVQPQQEPQYESQQGNSLDDGDCSFLSYQVFSREFDRQVSASTLAPHLNYAALKAAIDEQLPQFASLSRRLANKLRRHLLSLQKSAWQDDLEEGYLNSARLAGAVASPIEARPFRQLTHQPMPKCAISLLIDCSGSMKEQPLLMAAAWVDAMVGALEMCQVKVEVLGFTTGHWDDGPVNKEWQKQYKQKQLQSQWQSQDGVKSAGRLNDLLHIEFKSFDQPWRRARNGLAAVLDSNWQKENIDGEALSWAYQRLKCRAEGKKMLFVLADAKPYDQSTVQSNGGQYLEQDLINRVGQIEQDPQIELMAIGIGHRVCRVYANSLQINQLEDLPYVMLDALIEKL